MLGQTWHSTSEQDRQKLESNLVGFWVELLICSTLVVGEKVGVVAADEIYEPSPGYILQRTRPCQAVTAVEQDKTGRVATKKKAQVRSWL